MNNDLEARRLLAEAIGGSRDPQSSQFDYRLATERRAAVIHAVMALPARLRHVLLFRYGLLDGKEYTHEEIGALYGVTGECIRGIEAKALRKLRHFEQRGKLAVFVCDRDPCPRVRGAAWWIRRAEEMRRVWAEFCKLWLRIGHERLAKAERVRRLSLKYDAHAHEVWTVDLDALRARVVIDERTS